MVDLTDSRKLAGSIGISDEETGICSAHKTKDREWGVLHKCKHRDKPQRNSVGCGIGQAERPFWRRRDSG